MNPDLERVQTVLGYAYITQIKIKDSKAAFEKANRLDIRRDPGRIYEEWDELFPDWPLTA